MKKEFIQLSRAWYGETCLKDRRNISDEVTVMVTKRIGADPHTGGLRRKGGADAEAIPR